MKSTLITIVLTLLFFGAVEAQSPYITFKWTPENEKILSQVFKSRTKLVKLSAQDEIKVENCFISKLKSRFPNGFRLRESEFGDICEELGFECRKVINYKGLYPWTADNEKTMKKLFLDLMPKGFSASERKTLSECMVGKLKIKHPNGVNPVLFRSEEYINTFLQISDACIVRHKNNTKTN